MDNLDNFKLFVKANPQFASYIKDGSMTWQKFYELYDMYGEDSELKHFLFYKISQPIEKWSFFCQIFNLGIA